MKILSLLTYYYPHWTGLTLHAQLLAEGLVKQGHAVTVATSQYKKDLSLLEKLNGVDIVRFPAPIQINRTVIMPSLFFKILPLLQQHDVIHIHSPYQEAAYIAFVAKLLGKKVIITHHGDVHLPKGFINAIIGFLMNGNLTIAAYLADKLLAYSDDYAKNSYYLSRFLQKTTSVYPPIIIPTPKLDQVELMRKKQRLDGKVIIGVSGRFVEEKGYDFLLQSIPYIVKEIPNCSIVFIGEHKTIVYEKFYEKNLPLIKQNEKYIQFYGLITDKQELANFYAMCDVLAHPSRTECFALVQVEAMLCGTPVVASDIPGGRVPVTVTGMGRLFPSGNVNMLASTLIEVIKNRKQYCKPQKLILDQFSYEKTIADIENVYKSVLEK